MKVFILHDDEGKIRGTLAPSSKKINIGVKSTKGLYVHEIEVKDAEGDAKHKLLSDLHYNHIVDMTSGTRKLIKKAAQSKKPKK